MRAAFVQSVNNRKYCRKLCLLACLSHIQFQPIITFMFWYLGWFCGPISVHSVNIKHLSIFQLISIYSLYSAFINVFFYMILIKCVHHSLVLHRCNGTYSTIRIILVHRHIHFFFISSPLFLCLWLFTIRSDQIDQLILFILLFISTVFFTLFNFCFFFCVSHTSFIL